MRERTVLGVCLHHKFNYTICMQKVQHLLALSSILNKVIRHWLTYHKNVHGMAV